MLPSIFEQLAASDVPFRWIGGFLSSWSLACPQAVCSRISTTFAIFRQKSCRAFFAFPFLSRFFRLSRFSAFPFFPPFPLFRSLKKNKSLCGGDSYETVLRYDDLHNTSIFFIEILETFIHVISFFSQKCMKLVMKDEPIRGMIWRYAIINPNNNYSARRAVSLNINYRISFESSRRAEQGHVISRDQRYRRFSYQTRCLQRCSLRLPTRSKSTQTGHLYTTAQAGTDPRHFRM